MNIDLMSISGHKIYGPKGVGALYVRRRPRVRLEALMSGGGQERGMRSGTLATALCVGIGKACEVAKADMECDTEYINFLSARLIDGINAGLTDIVFNGDRKAGYPGCVNLSFAFVEGESLLMALKVGTHARLCCVSRPPRHSSASGCRSELTNVPHDIRPLFVGRAMLCSFSACRTSHCRRDRRAHQRRSSRRTSFEQSAQRMTSRTRRCGSVWADSRPWKRSTTRLPR